VSTYNRFDEFICENGLNARFDKSIRVWSIFILGTGDLVYRITDEVARYEFTPGVEEFILCKKFEKLFGQDGLLQ
jgi:hypothetical protein